MQQQNRSKLLKRIDIRSIPLNSLINTKKDSWLWVGFIILWFSAKFGEPLVRAMTHSKMHTCRSETIVIQSLAHLDHASSAKRSENVFLG